MNVFITGASSGIGAALARHYAARGANLGLVARRRTELEKIAETLGIPNRIYACDVTDVVAMREAAVDFIAAFGATDIVIANAGVSVGTLTEYAEDIEAFQRVMAINVIGLVATFQPFIARMREQRSGSLVGIASVAGIRGLPGAEAYSASKAAAISYLESLRVELKNTGIAVTTICPGYIATPMTAVNSYSMPFMLQPEEAAKRFACAIKKRVSYTVIPWQMGLVAKVLRLMPNWLYDRLFANALRKPRNLPL